MLIDPARRPAARDPVAEMPTPLPKMEVEDVGLSSNLEEPVEQFPLNADVLPPMYDKSDAGAVWLKSLERLVVLFGLV